MHLGKMGIFVILLSLPNQEYCTYLHLVKFISLSFSKAPDGLEIDLQSQRVYVFLNPLTSSLVLPKTLLGTPTLGVWGPICQHSSSTQHACLVADLSFLGASQYNFGPAAP